MPRLDETEEPPQNRDTLPAELEAWVHGRVRAG
jgi:hypothetical protein